MNAFDNLLARASQYVAGQEANELLWNVRANLMEDYGSAVLYEAVIPDDAQWVEFLATLIPRITEHFSAKGLPMLGAAPAIVSLWRGSTLYLFESAGFFAGVREILGEDERGFWERVSEWRQALGLSIPREALGPRPQLAVPPERALALSPLAIAEKPGD